MPNSPPPGIQVSIVVEGNVENSEIVGAKVVLPNGETRGYFGKLFSRFLTEYLCLPSLSELDQRISVRKAIHEQRLYIVHDQEVFLILIWLFAASDPYWSRFYLIGYFLLITESQRIHPMPTCQPARYENHRPSPGI